MEAKKYGDFMRGRKNVWDSVIEPNLNKIKKLLGEGATEKEVARAIGVAFGTWCKYKNLNPEFRQFVVDARAPAIEELESAMFKTACGFERVTRKPMKLKKIEYENGRKIREEETIVYYDDVEYYRPDVTAGIFLMVNWGKGKYSRDPGALELRKEELELKKSQQW